jgi:hypothetical protein
MPTYTIEMVLPHVSVQHASQGIPVILQAFLCDDRLNQDATVRTLADA